MADYATPPDAGAGAAKLLATQFLSPIPGSGLLALADADVRERLKAEAYGATKGVLKAAGRVPSDTIMSRINMAGAGVDAVTGDDSEDSLGRRMGRYARGEMQRMERDSGGSVATGDVAANLALSLSPGGGVPGAVGEATSRIASRLAGAAPGAVGRVGSQVAAGAFAGGATAAFDSAMEEAHKELLDDGSIDYGKAAAAGAKGFLPGLVIGGGLGGTIAAGAEALSHAGKASGLIRKLGARQFAKDVGIAPEKAAELDAAAEGRLSKIFEDAASADKPHEVFAQRAKSAADAAQEAANPAKELIDRLQSHTDDLAENAASVARRNAEARLGGIAEEASSHADKVAGPYHVKLGESEAAVQAATARRNEAVGAYEAARDAIIAQKQSELSALQSVDPGKPLRESMRQEILSTRRALSSQLDDMSYKPIGQRNVGKIRLVEEKLAGLMDEVEDRYAPKIAAAEEAHQKAIAELQSHIDNPEKLMPADIRKGMDAADRDLSKAFKSHGRIAEKLSEKLASAKESVESRYAPAIKQAQKDLEAHLAEVEAFRAAKAKELASHLDDLNAGKYDKALKSFGHVPEVGQALRTAQLASEEAATYEAINKSLSSAEARPLVDKAMSWLKGKAWKHAIAGGILGGPMGAVAGIGKGAALASVDGAISHFLPAYKSNAIFKAAQLSEAVGATMTVDGAARAAVDHLFGQKLPIAVSTAMAPGFLSSSQNPSKAATDHVQRLSAETQNTDSLTTRIQQSVAHLPPEGQAQAAAKMTSILANIRARSPKPVIQQGPFGEPPQFADSDLYAYEDYAAAASDPAFFLKALKSHSATPAMADAIHENWPELIDTMRDQFMERAGGGRPDTQAIRQMELLFGDALLPENRKDNVDFVQHFYDQNNRTNQPGSQGGGSKAASAMGKSVKTPAESMSAAR
mgnify:FL=1